MSEPSDRRLPRTGEPGLDADDAPRPDRGSSGPDRTVAPRPDRDAPGPDRDGEPGIDRDDEPPPTGPRRILIALYVIFALAATSRGIVQVATTFSTAPLAYVLSLCSGVVYCAAAVGLISDRAWSRGLAWAACGTELVGVLVIGTASLIDRAAFPHDTVWSRFGSGYGYFPVLLPLLGLMWLWYSRPGASQSRL